uniref:Methanethiol oxidase n=1 Tax=Noctiluca scintillans TaxID=2966 RepID=A0A7S1AX73_NOCSC|mmetsp:Transcript_6322/g.17608  ORF Transcript_6322/g.17608 Transcript_6322/m.17608 type:complete len:483 (+) Transcript_6322:74-1522(+)
MLTAEDYGAFEVAERKTVWVAEGDSLPDDFPPFRVVKCETERRCDGVTLISLCNPAFHPPEKRRAPRGYIVALDRCGRVIWYLQEITMLLDFRFVDGRLTYMMNDNRLVESDLDGEVLRQWHAHHAWIDGVTNSLYIAPHKTLPNAEVSIAVDVKQLHHSFDFLPNGNICALSAEMFDVAEWYGCDVDPTKPKKPSRLAADVIVEFTPSGYLVRSISLADVLGTTDRIGYNSVNLMFYWLFRGFPATCDWTHANSVRYSVDMDAFVLSVRHMDCVLSVNRVDHKLRWILGTPTHWDERVRAKCLVPLGDVDFPFHQHDVSIHSDGRIMVFDNGNSRAIPFQQWTPMKQCESYVTMWQVDEVNHTVKQEFSYKKGPFSPFVSGAFLLSNGSVFATFGGIMTGMRQGTDYEENPGACFPKNMADDARCRFELIEFTAAGETVFHVSCNEEEDVNAGVKPVSWVSFRSEHVKVFEKTDVRTCWIF